MVATVREVSVAVQATGAGQDGQEPEEVVDSLAHRVVGFEICRQIAAATDENPFYGSVHQMCGAHAPYVCIWRRMYSLGACHSSEERGFPEPSFCSCTDMTRCRPHTAVVFGFLSRCSVSFRSLQKPHTGCGTVSPR